MARSWKLAELFVEITADTASFNSKINRTKANLQALSVKMEGVARFSRRVLLAGFAGLGVALFKASDAEEIESKFKAVFKETADDAAEWAKTIGDAVGRSDTRLKAMLSTFQDTFVPLGFARTEAAKFSKQLTQLTLDLSSFNNEASDETLRSLQSALVGNHETVRRYGVIISETTLKQELFRMGVTDMKNELINQQKVQARLNLIMRNTADAQGDAVRTGTGFANTVRRLTDEMSKLAEEVGAVFLDDVKTLINLTIKASKGAGEWVKENKALLVSITATVGGLFALGAILPTIITGIGLLTGAIGSLVIGFTALASINIAQTVFFAASAFKAFTASIIAASVAIGVLNTVIAVSFVGAVGLMVAAAIHMRLEAVKVFEDMEKAARKFGDFIVDDLLPVWKLINKALNDPGDGRQARFDAISKALESATKLAEKLQKTKGLQGEELKQLKRLEKKIEILKEEKEIVRELLAADKARIAETKAQAKAAAAQLEAQKKFRKDSLQAFGTRKQKDRERIKEQEVNLLRLAKQGNLGDEVAEAIKEKTAAKLAELNKEEAPTIKQAIVRVARQRAPRLPKVKQPKGRTVTTPGTQAEISFSNFMAGISNIGAVAPTTELHIPKDQLAEARRQTKILEAIQKQLAKPGTNPVTIGI